MKTLLTTVFVGFSLLMNAQFCKNGAPHEQNDRNYRQVITDHPECCSNPWSSICEDYYTDQLEIQQQIASISLSTPTATRNAEAMPIETPRMPGMTQYIARGIPANYVSGASCATVLSGSAPYPEYDAIMQEVFALDGYCCNVMWDATCQNEYDAILNGLDCITVTNGSSPYGFDNIFFISVISSDTFCCESSWDAICQDEFNTLVGDCPSYAGASPPPYPSSDIYLQIVMNDDSFCCSNGWDDICEAEYQATVIADCASYASASPPPYPSDDLLLQEVIASDSFCCNNSWDQLCQNQYDALLLIQSCPALALDPDAVILINVSAAIATEVINNESSCCDIFDVNCTYGYFFYFFGCTNPLASNYSPLALEDDGSCETCDGDIDQDGTVGSSDLLVFLSTYGSACAP